MHNLYTYTFSVSLRKGMKVFRNNQVIQLNFTIYKSANNQYRIHNYQYVLQLGMVPSSLYVVKLFDCIGIQNK